MDKGKQFVEDTLMHYKSKYYDPVKAHEYYMRTRELAAENAKTALTTRNQRDAFAVVKDSVGKAQKTESEAKTAAVKSRMEELQKTAEAAAKKISDKIDAFAEQVKNDLKAVKVNEIPKDASPKLRAFLENQNRNIRAQAAAKAQKEYGDTAGQGRRDQINISRDLQSSVSKAREEYTAAMNEMKARYVADLAKEKANIRAQIK